MGHASSSIPVTTPRFGFDIPLLQQNPSGAGQTLSLEVPAHLVKVVLGRPTERSITANVLAYQDGEGYLEYGTQAGVHPSKTPLRPLTKGEPVEIQMDGLQPNTQYFYQLSQPQYGGGARLVYQPAAVFGLGGCAGVSG